MLDQTGQEYLSQIENDLYQLVFKLDRFGHLLGVAVLLSTKECYCDLSPVDEFSCLSAASTTFFVDPIEKLIVILITQIINISSDLTYEIGNDIKNII